MRSLTLIRHFSGKNRAVRLTWSSTRLRHMKSKLGCQDFLRAEASVRFPSNFFQSSFDLDRFSSAKQLSFLSFPLDRALTTTACTHSKTDEGRTESFHIIHISAQNDVT